jgi:SAM-dependent methyltransferase
MDKRDWIPVAPCWERNPDDGEIWRRVPVLPSLGLNRAELDLLAPVAGRATLVVGVGDGTAALALAAMGARVIACDSSQSMLDMLMIRARLTGVEVSFQPAELPDLAEVSDGAAQLAYAAQAAGSISDLARFYDALFRLVTPGGRLVVNEYHPFRRIWKPESGHPRVRQSYFQRSRERDETEPPDPTRPGAELCRTEYCWTVSDHFHFLTKAGFRVAAIEEVGEVRQNWEVPNLKGLPEQLVIAADRA